MWELQRPGPSVVSCNTGGSEGGVGQCQTLHHLPTWSRANSPLCKMNPHPYPSIQGCSWETRDPKGTSSPNISGFSSPTRVVVVSCWRHWLQQPPFPPCCTNGSVWGSRDLPTPQAALPAPMPLTAETQSTAAALAHRAADQPCLPRRLHLPAQLQSPQPSAGP